MDKLTIYNNTKKESLPKYTVIKIPQYKNTPKYTKFKNFLENNVDTERTWPACDNEDIGALEVNGTEVQINLKKCIGCMACLSTVKNLDKLNIDKARLLAQMYPKETLIEFDKKNVFNGQLFSFPFFPDRKTNTFSEFTSVKETKHLSLWAATVLNFLCSTDNSRIGKEIEIMKTDNPRDGRLDVCIDSNEFILIGEAKGNLDSLLTENRYRIQIPSYKRECQKFVDEYNLKYNKNKIIIIFLIVGGEESELLPETHPECSSRAGNKSKRFYDDLIKHNIKFVSANAILLLMLYSFYINKRICFDLLMSQINDNNFIGLTTAGIIQRSGNKLITSKINQTFLNSVAKSFS